MWLLQEADGLRESRGLVGGARSEHDASLAARRELRLEVKQQSVHARAIRIRSPEVRVSMLLLNVEVEILRVEHHVEARALHPRAPSPQRHNWSARSSPLHLLLLHLDLLLSLLGIGNDIGIGIDT